MWSPVYFFSFSCLSRYLAFATITLAFDFDGVVYPPEENLITSCLVCSEVVSSQAKVVVRTHGSNVPIHNPRIDSRR